MFSPLISLLLGSLFLVSVSRDVLFWLSPSNQRAPSQGSCLGHPPWVISYTGCRAHGEAQRQSHTPCPGAINHATSPWFSAWQQWEQETRASQREGGAETLTLLCRCSRPQVGPHVALCPGGSGGQTGGADGCGYKWCSRGLSSALPSARLPPGSVGAEPGLSLERVALSLAGARGQGWMSG